MLAAHHHLTDRLFPYPPDRRPKSIYFDTPNDEFAVAKSDAKFKVAKEGDLYRLTPLF